MIAPCAARPDRLDYLGLRMSAAEFLALPETDERYELVDGVILMSPSASWGHQRIVTEILTQLTVFLRDHPIGVAVMDIDVKLRDDLVLRPNVVYLCADKAARVKRQVIEPPDLVVEVVSPGAARRDLNEKRSDYEAAGAAEYWVIDPQTGEFHFFTLSGGRYAPFASTGERLASKIIPGFEMNLERLGKLF